MSRLALALAASLALTGVGALAIADAPKGGYAPDPQPIANKKQLVFQIVAKNGKVAIEKASSVSAQKPIETPRMTGRFAIELWVGTELLDRVRFNVPLLGDEPPEKNPKNPFSRPDTRDVTTRLKVQMADNDRARYLLFVDRSTGETQKLAWPPDTDGHLVPWTPATFSTVSAWPPASSPPSSPSSTPDAGAALPRDAGAR